jgi:hypothetical protein
MARMHRGNNTTSHGSIEAQNTSLPEPYSYTQYTPVYRSVNLSPFLFRFHYSVSAGRERPRDSFERNKRFDSPIGSKCVTVALIRG